MEYKVESTELTDIADAIREKSGSQDALTFPDEFVSEIRSIPTGSTSIVADEYDDQSTYDVGDYVVYENALYKCNTAITTAEEWTSAHWDEVTVMEEVETKADTDGMYEDMSVGNLISTQFVENKEPYLFRRTGNGKNIDGSEKAFIEEIIGGTVAWNQLVQNGNFSDGTSGWYATNGSTLSATSNVLTETFTTAPTSYYSNRVYNINMPFVGGHKYLLLATVKPSKSGKISVYLNSGSQTNNGISVLADTWTEIYCVNNANANASSFTLALGSDYSNFGIGDTLQIKNAMAIDLTALFGSAEIADYVYSLEQTTSGSGIAWLKSHGFIDGSYRAYDSGSLQSVKTSEHRTVGFNQLNKGNLTQHNTNSVRTSTNIPVIGGLAYELCSDPIAFSGTSHAAYIVEIDANGTETDHYSTDTLFTSLVVAMKVSTVAVRLDFYDNAGMSLQTVKDANPCLHLRYDGSRDGEYEPYEVHSYPLDPNLELRGKFKLDANNNLYADGDEYAPDGSVNRRWKEDTIAITSMYAPTSGGNYNPNFDFAVFSVSEPWLNNTQALMEMLTSDGSYFPNVNFAGVSFEGAILSYSTSSKQLCVSIAKGSTLAQAQAKYDGVKILYELATPTTETAQPYASPQVVNPLGTEEYIDTRDVPVPVGHETKYMANLREKIEDLPWDLSMIAPVENGTTASKAYLTGQYFLKDNQFCKALTSIASGATFTLNTNYAVTTVANELYTALHS